MFLRKINVLPHRSLPHEKTAFHPAFFRSRTPFANVYNNISPLDSFSKKTAAPIWIYTVSVPVKRVGTKPHQSRSFDSCLSAFLLPSQFPNDRLSSTDKAKHIQRPVSFGVLTRFPFHRPYLILRYERHSVCPILFLSDFFTKSDEYSIT